MHRPKFPKPKPVMIVSDYPIISELEMDEPYSSASNLSLLSDLHKVGIKQSSCHMTYLNYERPDKPDWFDQFSKTQVDGTWKKIVWEKSKYISEYLSSCIADLLDEIEKVNPKLIVIIGKWSLYLLCAIGTHTGTTATKSQRRPNGSLSKYRASILNIDSRYDMQDVIVFPLLPPLTKQLEPDKSIIMSWDYRKLGSIFDNVVNKEIDIDYYLKPDLNLIVGDKIAVVFNWLCKLEELLDKEVVKVSADIETRHGTIDCIGLGYNLNESICIPFSTINSPSYWMAEDELLIQLKLFKVFKHPNFRVVGQNWAYDSQYLHKFWLVLTNAEVDTMILHHVLYNTLPKDLSTLASVYCEKYRYWKDMQKFGKLEG